VLALAFFISFDVFIRLICYILFFFGHIMEFKIPRIIKRTVWYMDIYDKSGQEAGGYIVPADVSFTSSVLARSIQSLQARYPFLRVGSVGTSVMGRPLFLLEIGDGPNAVFYNAAHHANEWITSLLLMRFLESYARKCAFGGKIFDIDARSLYSKTTLSLMPMVNPDGVDLVTGGLTEGIYYEQAALLAQQYPDIPFPDGWKANLRGVDLNLQYPAGWENARAIKFSQGNTSPGPRDYVGPAPLSEPESRAVYELTRSKNFTLTLSLHTQGKTIYWKYLDYEVKNAYDIAQKFALVSGYEIEETPITSGYAGYKDWFISAYGRPGCTIEAGEGVSPLPLSQFQQIYADCVGILTLGMF
jgi:g-D-glutamyl-meso-diaminopimelate peptidase